MSYRNEVVQGKDGWLLAQAVDLPELLTQGRDLDELAAIVCGASGALILISFLHTLSMAGESR